MPEHAAHEVRPMAPAAPRARLLPRREFLAAGASALGLLGAAAVLAPRLGWLPEAPAAEVDPRALVGTPAPALVATTLDGATWDSIAYAGRPIWINVWATWCPPCRTEMPEINEVARTTAADGLAFLALNFQEDPRVIEQYLENTHYDFAIGLDPTGELTTSYGVSTLPAHIFIGRDGRLAAIRIGGMTRAEMETQVRALIAAPSRET